MGSYVHITNKILKSVSLKLYLAERPTNTNTENDYNNRNKKLAQKFVYFFKNVANGSSHTSASDDML